MGLIPPIHEMIDCAPLGHTGLSVQVRINPTNAQAEAYWETLRASIDASGAAGEADDAGKEAALATLAEAEAAYEDAIVPLIAAIYVGAECHPILTRADLAVFEDDSQVLAYALWALWERRKERLAKAKDSFRGTANGLPVQA